MQKDDMNISHVRHSLAHLLAAAVMELWPDTKPTIGPVIENGFYYDFEFSTSISESDLPKIEEKMREILPTWNKFERIKSDKDHAQSTFLENQYKNEIIQDLANKGEEITLYKSGNFVDLCRGGHVENIKEINPKAFTLTKVAGAYWRGDEKNPQLTRIYGIAFQTKQELDEYLAMLEEAEKRDHRVLGKELGLFVFSNLVGPGLPLYTQKGANILNRIKEYSRELRREIGYEEVETPNINKAELFKISGHYEKFKDDMFQVHSHYTDEEYFLKPMNCPQATQLYAAESRSYRDLPIRLADMALLYRDEKPGELSGLTRLRSFSQDDAHTFLRENQIEDEFLLVLAAIRKAMTRYGLSYHIRLSLRDPKNKEVYLGSDEVWERSQKTLKDLLKKHGIEHVEAEGEAAFYGPKMDLMVKDSLGRTWQLSTIQLDFNQPTRFGLEYVDQDGSKKTPVMIHSALVGSPERFFGIIIEHYGGAFPLWLAPIQVSLLPVNDSVLPYIESVASELKKKNIRVSIDSRNETIGKKIREAEMQKIPYLFIIGPKEVEAKTVAVRERGKGDQGQMPLEKFFGMLKTYE